MNPNFHDPKRRSLGRGLSALLGPEAEADGKPAGGRAPNLLPIGALRPGRFQPRRHFDAEEMQALVQSVRMQGILQPILVRRLADEPESYEIVAGERRWRAAQTAQLHEIPVIVRELDDRQALEFALVENLQREDLGALEEAAGYRRLMQEFERTQEELARLIGKSRSHVANMLRLLELPQPVRAMLESGALTAGHARALLAAADPVAAAREVTRQGLNVRQTERLAQRGAQGRAKSRVRGKDAEMASLEHMLTLRLGLKVKLDGRGAKGTLTLHYTSVEQLEDLMKRLTGV